MRGLHIINPNIGWVEYLHQNNQEVYYTTGITKNLYLRWCQSNEEQLVNNFHKRNSPFYGLLKNLVQIRIDTNFLMPLFATGDHSVITCGSTRFAAHQLCNSSPDQIAVVFLLNPGEKLPTDITAERIQSTEHFDLIAKLTDTNYTIDFNTNGPPRVSSSVVHQLDYQVGGQTKLVNQGNSIFDFWQRFTHENKIKITVSCTNPDQITYNPSLWNVEILRLQENSFGYGAVMQKFQEPSDGKLHVWINGNYHLDLEQLLVWPDNRGACWWQTQDKNLHMFETTAGPQSVHRTISIIGNIVK